MKNRNEAHPLNNTSQNTSQNISQASPSEPGKKQLPLIRAMSEEDLPEIMQIEQASFPNPWSLTSFQSELRENELAHYHCLVYQNHVIGYMGYWAVFDEAHVTNVAIRPEHRGKGWGEYLLRAVMYHCVQVGMARMTLEVRVSNDTALRMYQKLGFATMGVRPRYYSDNQEDAYIMWVTL